MPARKTKPKPEDDTGMLIGGDPNALFDLPGVASFGIDVDSSEDYLLAPQLQEIGELLVDARAEQLPGLRELNIEYRWKRVGGKSEGRPIVGKCVKTGDLLKHSIAADFVIWIGADHARNMGMTRYQAEAAVFHELRHAGIDEEKGTPQTRGHEFEGFFDELDIYGPWHAGLKEAHKRMRQMKFDL